MLRRLRRLTEAECYARLYGRDEESVRVIRVVHRRTGWRPRLSAEVLRGLLESSPDAREADAA